MSSMWLVNNLLIVKGITKEIWKPMCQSLKDASAVDKRDNFSEISWWDELFSTSLPSCLKNKELGHDVKYITKFKRSEEDKLIPR